MVIIIILIIIIIIACIVTGHTVVRYGVVNAEPLSVISVVYLPSLGVARKRRSVVDVYRPTDERCCQNSRFSSCQGIAFQNVTSVSGHARKEAVL